MTHNGIEYGDMQLICEAYFLMRELLGMSAPEMAEVFKKWNQGVLDSYLIEITADILSQTDEKTGKPMVDVILDSAGQKGTGKWTQPGVLGAWRSGAHGGGGRLCTLHVRCQAAPGRGQPSAARRCAALYRRTSRP